MSVYNSKTKRLFVHIPKTAGKSIREMLFGRKPPEIKNDRSIDKNYHSTYDDCAITLPDIDQYYKFTVVRNPWDRASSWYFFRKEILYNTLHLKKPKIRKIKWPDRDQLTIEYDMMQRDFNEWLVNYINHPWENTWFSLGHPQMHWIKDVSLFNCIIRFESLESDMLKAGLLLNPLPEFNVSQNSKNKYKELFSEETKRLIRDVYAEDIENFNYKF